MHGFLVGDFAIAVEWQEIGDAHGPVPVRAVGSKGANTRAEQHDEAEELAIAGAEVDVDGAADLQV